MQITRRQLHQLVLKEFKYEINEQRATPLALWALMQKDHSKIIDDSEMLSEYLPWLVAVGDFWLPGLELVYQSPELYKEFEEICMDLVQFQVDAQELLIAEHGKEHNGEVYNYTGEFIEMEMQFIDDGDGEVPVIVMSDDFMQSKPQTAGLLALFGFNIAFKLLGLIWKMLTYIFTNRFSRWMMKKVWDIFNWVFFKAFKRRFNKMGWVVEVKKRWQKLMGMKQKSAEKWKKGKEDLNAWWEEKSDAAMNSLFALPGWMARQVKNLWAKFKRNPKQKEIQEKMNDPSNLNPTAQKQLLKRDTGKVRKGKEKVTLKSWSPAPPRKVDDFRVRLTTPDKFNPNTLPKDPKIRGTGYPVFDGAKISGTVVKESSPGVQRRYVKITLKDGKTRVISDNDLSHIAHNNKEVWRWLFPEDFTDIVGFDQGLKESRNIKLSRSCLRRMILQELRRVS